MESRIEILQPKKLIGKHLKMSLSNNRTFQLWQSFIPSKKEIINTLTKELFCIQVYDNSLDFQDFNPDTEFEKWAAVEVLDFTNIPAGMQSYTLKGGLYAVFNYIGSSSEFQETFNFIHKIWLPKSGYLLDQREHFEILGEKYKNADPTSEEEIWIPIKKQIN